MNYVLLRTLKLTVTTALGPTVSTDALWTDDHDALIKVVGHHSHLATGATHSAQGGQRWPPRRICIDGRSYRYLTATLSGRSDASCGCGSLVWIHCDASHTDRVKSRAFIMRCCSCHRHTRQDGREGAAWQCWQAERSGQRSAMLVRVANRVLVLT